jgi:protein-S-isoprenylcysteine O-methyltransferase Ste14
MSAASRPPNKPGGAKKGKTAKPSSTKAKQAEDSENENENENENEQEQADDEEEVSSKESSPTSSKSGEAPYRGSQPGGRAKGKNPSIWQRATYRWVAVTVVMAALLVMYTQHPYYRNQQFTPFKTIYPPAFFIWLTVGVFYVKATLEKFSGMRYMMRDSALHLLILARAWQNHRFWRVAKNRRVKTTLLAIIVKAFFTPLMTGFFVGHLNSISRAWLTHKHLAPIDFKTPIGSNVFTAVQMWWTHVAVRLTDFIPSLHDLAMLVQPWTWSRGELSWGLGLAYDLIFAIDCGWALFGYSTESRWLGNKTRSVEPTAFGWAVCLACYPPYNNVLGTYLPLENGPSIVTSDNALLALRGATVLLFAIYASATVSFGFRFSNLTNRGIVSRGPYRFVRHPAYLTKCTAWWLEHIPTLTLTKAFFLTLLCGVYALRAWTEERHLGMDPDYRAYKKKVRWVLFPGVY